MKCLSVCSGIGAPEVAWSPLGWEFVASADIEAFPNAVRAARFPSVPNWGDMTKFQEWPNADVDLLVGGTPCQSFSVAGLRKGLTDPRGNLALTFLAIAQRYAPQWIVWENVPGVLSSNGGRDFGAFLAGLGQCGYGWAYRVLDAQYFGVAQRRRRVFVVGCLGDWRRAAAVLFERHSLQGHPAPSREAGKGSAVGTLGGTSPGGGWRFGADEAAAGQLIAANTGDTAACLTHHAGRYDLDTETFVATTLRARDGSKGVDSDCTDTLVPVAYRTSGNCGAWETGDRVDALTTGTDPNSHLVRCITGDVAHTLKAEGFDASEDGTGRGQPMVNHAAGVRRLTPRECERLQGFPDDWTLTPYRGKPAADGPRYKALGNSMAVPVMAWIGKRIEMVEAFTSPAAAPAQAAE